MLVTIIVAAIVCIMLYAIITNAYEKSDTTVASFSSAQLPVGGACKSNKDCVNGACGRAGAGGALNCCASGNTDSYMFYDYCTKMPSGTPCWSDAMCSNGSCQKNHGPFKHGTCK